MVDYFEAIQPYLVYGALAFAVTFALTAFALFLFPKMGLMDRPQKYGLSRRPIPYSGGLVPFFVFLTGVLMFVEWDKHVAGLVFAALMIVTVSFLDDRYGLNPFVRLAVQGLAAFTLVLAGIGIDTITNPLGGVFHLDGWSVPFDIAGTIYHFTVLADLFTVLWIVALINAVNWLDGVPGLVSGISAIAATVMFILSVRPDFHFIDQTQAATFAILIAGCAAAFWWFDFSPPKILMGDTGSMFFGFMLAVLAIFSGGKIATTFLIMGFPLLDFLWVIVRRVFQGKSPFRGDLFHFHHRLLRAGFTARQAVVFIYMVCALFGGIALFLGSEQKLIAAVALTVLMIVMGFFVVLRGRSLDKVS